MTTLYITDMDGTLLDDRAQVSPRSSGIITALSDRGAMITVATARTPATVVPLMRHARINPPAIVMTGAALWDTVQGRYSEVRFIPADVVSQVICLFREGGITPFIYVLDDDLRLDVYHEARHFSRQEQAFADERSGSSLKRLHAASVLPCRAMRNTLIFFAMGERDRIEAVAEAIRRDTSCSVSCYPDTYDRSTGLLEVFAPGVSKASAVRHLKSRMKADRVVVFGDNLNDLPMFAEADIAVAVENALPEVKAQADIIIGPNQDDSVARFIEYDYNSGKNRAYH